MCSAGLVHYHVNVCPHHGSLECLQCLCFYVSVKINERLTLCYLNFSSLKMKEKSPCSLPHLSQGARALVLHRALLQAGGFQPRVLHDGTHFCWVPGPIRVSLQPWGSPDLGMTLALRLSWGTDPCSSSVCCREKHGGGVPWTPPLPTTKLCPDLQAGSRSCSRLQPGVAQVSVDALASCALLCVHKLPSLRGCRCLQGWEKELTRQGWSPGSQDTLQPASKGSLCSHDLLPSRAGQQQVESGPSAPLSLPG